MLSRFRHVYDVRKLGGQQIPLRVLVAVQVDYDVNIFVPVALEGDFIKVPRGRRLVCGRRTPLRLLPLDGLASTAALATLVEFDGE